MHVSLLRYWSFKLISLGGMALVVFALPHLMSRQPVTLYENWPANAQQRARLISDYGFDRPLPTQGALWLQRLVTGQWGASRYSNRPVFQDIWQATSRTTLLLLWTLLACSLGTAVLWSMHHLAPWLSALLPRSQLLAILEALPSFLVAVFLRELIIWQLGWVSMANLPLFEPYYFFNPVYMLLPAAILALTPLRVWYTQSLGCHGQRYPLRQRLQHFRTSFRPHLEYFLLEVSLTEYVFAFPGVGSLGIEALKRRDIPVLQGFILCTGALYFVLRCLCEWGASPHQQALSQPTLPHVSPPRPAFSPQAVYTGFWCLLILGAVTLWAPALVLYDPMEIHSRDQFLAPGYRYALGTDFLGRDVLSRTVKGFRSSIPRVVVLTVIIGGVSWLVLNDKWRIQGLLSLWWRAGLALLHSIPSFVLAFMVFVVFEHHAWALDIALAVAGLPVAAQLMTEKTTPLQRVAHCAQLGGLVLLLEVTFYFLNLNTESFTPTWGGDLRHGMHYGHINIWMVLAPTLAVAWSRYSFHQLHYGLPRQRHTVGHEHQPMMRQSDSEDVRR
jgi:peptide/nickel transport system permease protein